MRRALVTLALVVTACASSPNPAPGHGAAALPSTTAATARVTAHTDGDTLRVDGVAVRLIGIDAPETHHPTKGVQCYGVAAARHLADLLPIGSAVRLTYDVDRFDRYGRTLAYLYRAADGLFVNAALVRDGDAQIRTVPPNVAHAEEFLALQRAARAAGRGLWSACPVQG